MVRDPSDDGASTGEPGRTTVAAAPTVPSDVAGRTGDDRLAAGVRLGRYVVRELIGAGGMGEVHEAYDPELDRRIAIKLLHRDLGVAASERLRREARTMARLSHRNVVAVHDVGEHEGRLFLAMERVDGVTLRAWCRDRPWRDVLRAYLDAGRGLVAAHEAGVVHRDFKPDNVLRGEDGRVAVTDFGIARQRGGGGEAGGDGGLVADVSLTRTGALVGTPLYMAPEQLEGGQADARSDQFSYAVALWQALYRRHPLVPPGAELEALTVAMRGGDALTVPSGPVPARVGRALVRALRPDPARRWPTLAALLDELDVFRPRTLRIAIAVGAAVAIAGLVAGVAFGQRPATAPSLATAPCEDGVARLAEVWSPARRDALGAELVATGVSLAGPAWQRAAATIDGWGRRWVEARTMACRATTSMRAQPAIVLEQRMRCFQLQLGTLDATLVQLQRPDRRVVQALQVAVDQLGDPSRCSAEHAERLADPQLAANAVPLRDGAERALALARAAQDVGRAHTARALAAVAFALGSTAGLTRIEAEAAFTEARALALLGDSRASLARYLDARRRADQVADDSLRAVATLMAAQRLYFLTDYPASLELLRDAEAMTSRAAEPATFASGVHGVRGAIELELGNVERAIAEGERAVALLEARRDPRKDLLANELARLATFLQAARRVDDAIAAYERAIALRGAHLGGEHPELAPLLVNLAGLLINEARAGDALPLLERSVRIRAGFLGEDHPSLGFNLANLGAAQRRLEAPEAEATLRRALELLRKNPDYEYALHGPLSGLANLLAARGRHADAVPLYEEALGRLEKRGAAAGPNLPDARFRLARSLWHAGPSPAQKRRALALARAARDGYAVNDAPRTAAEITAWLSAPATAPTPSFP